MSEFDFGYNTQMNRRRFLELSASAASVAILAQVSRNPAYGQAVSTQESSTDLAAQYPPIPEFIRLDELLPNDEANLVNAVVAPENLLPRTNREKVKMAVDFQRTFNKDNPDVLRNDLWGYGESVKDAIRRGQEVWLVLDIPDTVNQVSIEDLSRYFSAVFREYTLKDSVGVSRSARFVIGNELNAFQKTSSPDYLRWYAKLYVQAHLAQKMISNSIRLYPFSEAYYGSGEVLHEALSNILVEASLHRDESTIPFDYRSLIGGLCFHFYDDKAILKDRLKIYQSLAQQLGIQPSLHVLELGKPEVMKKSLSDQDHQHIIARNLLEALALAEEGIIETVFWHTAERVGDPNSHALFSYDTFGRLEPKPQFWTFQTMSKLFHHSVSWKEQHLENGTTRITVTGIASSGDRSEVSWIRTKNSDGSVLSESSPKLKVYPSSKLSLRRILRASLDKRE